jgi:hypothetical protein
MDTLLTLYDILEKSSQHDSPIYWLDDGEAFEIADKAEFSSDVLEKHFPDESFESFIARLVSLKFKKYMEGNECVRFSHMLFSRNNRSLVSMIYDPNISAELENGLSKKQGAAFLEKLYDILESGAYDDFISWCDEDGTSVLVKRVEEFSQVRYATNH